MGDMLSFVGSRKGIKARLIYKFCASRWVASFGDNHALPVLREIVHDDMIFVFFPLVSDGFFHHYERVEDAFKAMTDVLEVVSSTP